MANILIVDDELGIRDLLLEILNDEGHQVDVAENAAAARKIRHEMRPDLILLDIWMPDTDGVTLLKEWSAAGLLTMPVIMMSGHATIDTAVEATRMGAIGFLEKPITLQKLLTTVNQALSKEALKAAFAQPPAKSGSAVVEQDKVTYRSNAADPTVPSQQMATHKVFDLNVPLREARDAFEKAYFDFHLQKEAGSMTRVAEKTGLERTHLYRKLKQLGVDLGREKRLNG